MTMESSVTPVFALSVEDSMRLSSDQPQLPKGDWNTFLKAAVSPLAGQIFRKHGWFCA